MDNMVAQVITEVNLNLPSKSVQVVKQPGIITTTDNFNYAGRPMDLKGPTEFYTIQFTDRHGGFSWFDPETQDVWHRERTVYGSLYYACSYYKICKLPGRCDATPDCKTAHSHGRGGVPLYHLRQIRLEFLIRNYYALSRDGPTLVQFQLVHQFFHDRVHGSDVTTVRYSKVPNWVLSSAKLGYPYSCEARRAGADFSGIMEHPIRHVITALEVNAVFEAERFSALDQYVPCALPMDYREARMLKPVVPSVSYIRRWSIPPRVADLALKLCEAEIQQWTARDL